MVAKHAYQLDERSEVSPSLLKQLINILFLAACIFWNGALHLVFTLPCRC